MGLVLHLQMTAFGTFWRPSMIKAHGSCSGWHIFFEYYNCFCCNFDLRHFYMFPSLKEKVESPFIFYCNIWHSCGMYFEFPKIILLLAMILLNFMRIPCCSFCFPIVTWRTSQRSWVSLRKMYFAVWQLQLAWKWLRIIGCMDNLFGLTSFFLLRGTLITLYFYTWCLLWSIIFFHSDAKPAGIMFQNKLPPLLILKLFLKSALFRNLITWQVLLI